MMMQRVCSSPGARLYAKLPASASRPCSLLAPRRRVTTVRVRAADEDKTPKADADNEKVDTLLEELKNAGLTPVKAKELLGKWAEMGAKDPEALRKLLVKRSLQPFQVLGLQTVLDTAGSIGGFLCGRVIGDQPPFFGQPVAQIGATFFGVYYFLQVMIELSVLAACVYTAYRYGTNSAQVLAAVRQLAGPSGSGGSLQDRVAVAVNAVKVLQILDEIQDLLKEQYAEGKPRPNNTLKNLQAYLTLSHAKEKYGFRPERYGLDEKQAGNIASAFAVYDLNDDGKLELPELGKLCTSLGKTLSEDEVKEAMRVLDTSKNGTIEFEEWVAWWCGRHLSSMSGDGGDKPSSA